MRGNTVNPNRISRMTSPTDGIHMLDASQADTSNLDFNMEDFDNLNLDIFDQGIDYANAVDKFATGTPNF
jgi:hypothetical protein